MLSRDPPSSSVFTRQELDSVWDIPQRNGRLDNRLVPIFQELGIPQGQGDIQTVHATQDKDFTTSNGQRNTPSTGGIYNNQFIPKGRTIVAELNYSPRTQVDPGRPIPALNRWSDVVWLLWSGIAGNQAGNLKPPLSLSSNVGKTIKTSKLQCTFRNNVFSGITREVIEHIERTDGKVLDLPWPGHGYDMRTDSGKALLGSPHGIGVAYLLRDHRDMLGRKIPFVRVFTISHQPSEASSPRSAPDGIGRIKGRGDSDSVPI
ncbi:MAG: hypothetical protein Q9225_001173 [Loekoesia sp. 1 TL-2023]